MGGVSKNYREWQTARDKIFCFVASLSAIAFFMLICNMLDNSRELPSKNVTGVSLDSVCSLTAKEHIQGMDMAKYGTTGLDTLCWKMDSLCIRERILQQALSEIETRTEERQNDIRQETNNIINKFNGTISWWLLLLGVICGFAPMALTYLNHKNDTEYIKLLNSNYKEMLEDLERKKKELEELERDLKNKENIRSKKIEEQERLLRLMHSSAYTALITRKAKFQQSRYRDCIADKLLRTILLNSIEYFKDNRFEKNQTADFYWLMTTLESLELLIPFQKDRMKRRRMGMVNKELEELQESIYNGNSLSEEQIKSMRKSMEDFCDAFLK